MSKINMNLIAAVNADIFKSMPERDQFMFIHDHRTEVDLLRSLYPAAVGDVNKSWIVSYTKDSELANNLLQNSPYPTVKVRALQYADDQQAIKSFLMDYANNPEATKAIFSKLKPEDSTMLMHALQSLNITPDTTREQMDKKTRQNPLTD